MHWSFINKEEDIQEFKNGTYFDDAEIERLIVIGESRTQINNFQLSDTTRKSVASQIGLPFELISLADEDIEEFIKYKTGKPLEVPKDAKTDGVRVTSLAKKRTLEKDKSKKNKE